MHFILLQSVSLNVFVCGSTAEYCWVFLRKSLQVLLKDQLLPACLCPALTSPLTHVHLAPSVWKRHKYCWFAWQGQHSVSKLFISRRKRNTSYWMSLITNA
jgi:hypothetical protein